MEFRQLEVFLAVIESGGVTEAARRLGLTPGAVSLQLQNLSAQLRTELFSRSGKRLKPTPAAVRLAERARTAIQSVLKIEEEFSSAPERDRRPLHFVSGAATLIYRLGKPLRQLRRKYPDADIQVTVTYTEEMVAGLLDRRFDLALISLPYPEHGLRILPLFEEELLILRPSSHSIRGWHVSSITPKELQAAPFLLYPKRSNMRGLIEAFFRELGIAPRVVMESDDTETMKGLVECGFGYSILPESALRRQPRFFHVHRIPGRPVFRRQALALAKQAHPRALTEAIVEHLRISLTQK